MRRKRAPSIIFKKGRFWLYFSLVFVVLIFVLSAIFGHLAPLTIPQEEQPSSQNLSSETGLPKLKPEDELQDLRNETTKHYQNPDGSITAVISAAPVHYKDGEEWKDIVLDIEQNTSATHPDYAFASVKNETKRFYSASSGAQGLMIDFGEEVFKDWINPEMLWLNSKGETIKRVKGNIVKGVASSKSINYPMVYPSSDVTFEQSPQNRKMDVVLKDKSALADMPADASEVAYCEEMIVPQGWTYQTKTESENPKIIRDINFTNKDSKAAVNLYAPEIYEQNDPEHVIYGRYTLRQNGNAITICKVAPTDWLKAPERQFPVVVDPNLYASGSIYTGTTSSAGDKWTGDLDVGCWGSCTPTRRGYAYFDTSSIMTGASVTSSNLALAPRQNPASTMYVFFYVMSLNPLTATGTQIYNDTSRSYGIDTGITHLTTATLNSYLSMTLNANGISYLESSFSSPNYYAANIYSSTNSTYARYDRYDSGFSPRLYVWYTLPTIAVTATSSYWNGTNYWVKSGDNITVNGTTIGAGTCYVYWDTDETAVGTGGVTWSDTCDGTYVAPSSTTSNSPYYVCIRAYDAGVTSYTNYICDEMYYDSIAPTLTSVAVNNGAANSGQTVNVNLTGEADANSGLGTGAQIRLSCNGSTWSAYTYSDPSPNFDTQTGAGCVAGFGTKTIYVQIRDAAGNWSATRSDSIVTWDAPTVTGISPNIGPYDGGNTVTVTGTNFYTGAILWIDTGSNNSNSCTVNTSASMTCTLNSYTGATGTYGIWVVTHLTSATLPSAYTYMGAPTISTGSDSPRPFVPYFGRLSPNPETSIVITGTNFYNGSTNARVKYSDIQSGLPMDCATVTVVNTTTITCSKNFSVEGPVTNWAVQTDSGITATVPNGWYSSNYTLPAVTNATGYSGMGIANVNLIGDTTQTLRINNSTSTPNALVHNSTPPSFPWSTAFYTHYGPVQSGTPPSSTLGIPILKTYTSYPISITGGASYRMKVAVWIDINRDNDFADSGEMVLAYTDIGSVGGTLSTSISLPIIISAGQTRMRVGSEYYNRTGETTGNGPNDFGEFEDYYVTLQNQAAPTITSVSPDKGPLAGNTLTIVGTGFQTGANVYIGTLGDNNNKADPVIIQKNYPSLGIDTITAVIGPGTLVSGTTYNVYVQNSDLQYGTKTLSYTPYSAPTITAVNPYFGLTGTSLSITGTNFYDNSSVTASATLNGGAISCSRNSMSTTTYSCNAGSYTPANLYTGANPFNVSITTASGSVNSTGAAFNYSQYTLPTHTASGLNIGITNVALTGESPTALNQPSWAPPSITPSGSPASLPNISGTNAYFTNYAPGQSGGNIPNLKRYGTYNLNITGTADYYNLGAAWIDYNRDYDFGETDEDVVTGAYISGATASTPVTVPGTAGLGQTRLRVCSGNSACDASGNGPTAWGETEDYVVNIQAGDAPTLSAISPSEGPANQAYSVSITGTNLHSGATVYFGGNGATGVTVQEDYPVDGTDTITATTPSLAAGIYNVTVTNNDSQSATLTNSYRAWGAPALTSLNGNAFTEAYYGVPAGGNTINIYGNNFYTNLVNPIQAAIGGNACTNLTFVDSTRVTCVVPTGSGEGIVNVTVTTGPSNTATLTNGYAYNNYGLPHVSDTSHLLGISLVQLRGETGYTDYINNTSNTVWNLSHSSSPPALPYITPYFTNYTPSQITGNSTLGIPRLIRNHTYSMTLDGGTWAEQKGSVWLDSNHDNVYNQSGEILYNGAVIPVSGNVTFNVNIPANSQLGEARMRVGTDLYYFNVYGPTTYGEFEDYRVQILSQPTPTVTDVSPLEGASGAGSTVLTITGTNFESGAQVVMTRVGGGSGPYTYTPSSITSNSITVTVNNLASGDYDVSVVQADGTTGTRSNTFYAWPAATISDVTPNWQSTSGGGEIHISGDNFWGTISIMIGSTPCDYAWVDDLSSVYCDSAPALTAGTYDVSVTTGTNTAYAYGAITYYENPTVIAVDPNWQISSVGGGSLTITGTGFFPTGVRPANTVTIGGVDCSNTNISSSTTLTCTAPNLTAGTYNISVSTPVGTGTGTNLISYYSAPTVTSITQTHGPDDGGVTVDIYGTNFRAGDSSVTIGGNPATEIDVISNTHLTAVTPAGTAGAPVGITVTNSPDGQSGTLSSAYTYMDDPTFAGTTPFVPHAGPSNTGGTTITINGTNFYNIEGSTQTTISVGSGSCTGISINGAHTQLTCTLPSQTAGAKDIVLTTASGFAEAFGGYIYYDAPTITTVVPNALHTGALDSGVELTITGTNIYDSEGVSSAYVNIGGVSCDRRSMTEDTTFVCHPPDKGTDNDYTLMLYTRSGSDDYTIHYYDAPTVSSVEPDKGQAVGGDTVIITGTNFYDDGVAPTTVTTDAAGLVDFCVPASINILSSTEIQCTTEPGTGAVNIYVNTPSGQSAVLTSGYRYFAAPTVTSVTPSQGPIEGGQTITIAGTNFYDLASPVTTVTIGTAGCDDMVIAPTFDSLTCTTPANTAGTYNVTVTTPSGASNTNITYQYWGAPVINGLAPNGGPTGTSIEIAISGSNFYENYPPEHLTVTVGDVPCLSSSLQAWNHIHCTIPAFTGDPGSKAVVVTTPSGPSNSFYYTYYDAPTITRLTPISGAPAGNSQIYFYGTNFYDNLTYPISVLINNNPCQLLSVVSPTSLWCNIPAGTLLQVVDAAITTGSGTDTKTNAFVYDNYTAPLTYGTTNNMGLTRVALSGESSASLTLDNTSLTPDNLSHTSNPPSLSWPTPLYTNYVPVQSSSPPQSNLGVPVLERYGRYTFQAGKIYGADQHLGLWIDYNKNNSFADAGEFVLDDVHMGMGTTTYSTPIDIPAAAAIGTTRMRVGATATSENLRLGGYEGVAYGEFEDYLVNIQASSAPTITDFTPGVGPAAAGTAFTLTGTGIKPGARVYFDVYPGGPEATPSPITWMNDTTVTGFTPGLGSGTNHTVFIVNPDNQWASLSNAYLAYGLPTVTDLGYTYFDLPAGGTTININGTNFYNGVIPVTAFIGSEECTTTTYVSPTQVTCEVPPANPSAEGPVSVYVSTESGAGTPLDNAFIYNNYGLPTVTGLLNNFGTSLVQLRGETAYTDYINNTSNVPLNLSHVSSPPALPYTDAYYTNYAPAQSTGSVTLGIPRLVRSHTYSLTMDGGTAYDETGVVWIDLNQNNIFEHPDEALATGYIWLAGNLTTTITIPATAQLGETRMRTISGNLWSTPYGPNQYGEVEDYRVMLLSQPTPTVTDISPNYGPPSLATSDITITGTNFDSGAKVKIGTEYATDVTVVDSAHITATTPALAVGDYEVQVEQADGTASNILSGAEGFHVLGAPTVSSITPDEVAADTPALIATITGENFYTTDQYPVSISVGGQPCDIGVYVQNAQTIVCEYSSPATPGVYDVSVTTGSDTGTGNDLLTVYGAPTISSIALDYGSTNGGETVIITGTNFFPAGGSPDVYFGHSPGDLTPAPTTHVDSDTQITATTPGGRGVGLVDVLVTTDAGTATLTDGYEFLPHPINIDSSTLTSYSARIEPINTASYSYANFNPVNEDFVKVTLYEEGSGNPAIGRKVTLFANPSAGIEMLIADCRDPRHAIDATEATTDSLGTGCFRVHKSGVADFDISTVTLSATVTNGNYSEDATLSTTRELEIGPFSATSTLNYRYRNDDGSDLTASAIADTDVPFYNAVTNTAFRLRFGLTRNVPSGTDSMRFDEFSPTTSVQYSAGTGYLSASFKAFAGGYAVNENNNKLYVITPYEELTKTHVFKFDLNDLSQSPTSFEFPPVVNGSLPYGDRIDAPITSTTHNVTRTFIDPDNNLMYFVLTPYFADAPNHSIRVYKVNLTTETVVDVFEEPSDLLDNKSSISYDSEIDLTNGFLYLTISGNEAQEEKNARVMKIKLNGPAQAMTEVGQLVLGSASREITSSVIDLTNQYLYVTTEMPQKIVKIDLDVSPTLPPVVTDEITLVPIPSESPNETVGYQSAVIDTVEGYAYFASSTNFLGAGYDDIQRAFITKVDTDPNRTFEVVSRLNIAPSSPTSDDMTYANFIYWPNEYAPNEYALENIFPAASIDTTNGYAYFPATRLNQPRALGFHKIIRIHLSDFTRKSFNDEMIFSDDSAHLIKGTIFRPSTGRGYLIRPSVSPDYETLTEWNSTSRQNLKLQVAQALDNQYCNYDNYNSYVWNDLPNADFSISDSTYFSDGAATSNVTGLLYDNNDSFVPGQLKDSSSTTSRISLGKNQFSEIEYSLKPTAGAEGSYCFRLIDADPQTDNQVGRNPNLVYTLTGSNYDPTNYNIYPALSVGGLILSKTSINLIEGTTTDSYGIKLAQAPSSTVTVSVNADDSRLILSPDSTPGTPTETSLTFTTGNWDTYQYITVSAINNGTAEGTTTGLINHTVTGADAKFNNIIASPVQSVLTDYGSSSANVLATITGDATFTPPDNFSFPEAYSGQVTPNFSPALNLSFSETRGPSLDYVLTMQTDGFCKSAGVCIPLNRVFTATANLVNIYNTFNPAQISQFISNYLQDGENLTNRSTYVHGNPSEDRPLSSPITLIDTRNVPSGNSNNPLQGDLSFTLHLMIDYGSFNIPSLGTYITTLVFDFNTNP